MRVALVGAGMSGLVSAYVLAKSGWEVVVYEKEDRLGGHVKTVTIEGSIDLDLGFTVFNQVAPDPSMMEFLDSLGVDTEISDMSLSMSLEKGEGYEWGTRNGLSSLFAQKKNMLNPYFWRMVREINKFTDDVMRYLVELENNADIDRTKTLGHFIETYGYSELFQKAYLVPICSSIWSCSSEALMSFSAYAILSFFRNNNHLLQLFSRPQWLTTKWHSQTYVKKIKEELETRGCQIRTNCQVLSVSTDEAGCFINSEDGSQERYDGCIIATHAPDALKMLGEQATYDETRALGAFNYAFSDFFLHRDTNLMPRNQAVWSAWNFLGTADDKVCLTYWLNALQVIGDKGLPYMVTLNPSTIPKNTLLKWKTGHLIPSVAASKAAFELDHIQGKRGIWFSGAHKGYGFHENGLKAGMTAAHGMLKKSAALFSNPKHMVPSWMETGARLFVTRFFHSYIATGTLILLEEGGTIFTFQGTKKMSPRKVYLRVHTPQFYWKIATEADLGLADAYINGDFSFVDEKEGLLNLFMIFLENKNLEVSASRFNKRGWWTPLFLTAGVASAKYCLKHVLRKNTLSQARRNISRHYDLSNDLFALFMDETMMYSCAIFKSEDEDLTQAQMRKISLLIDKTRIRNGQEVLEIGCGWGTLAIEVVKQTGCKYTGITLSKEQLRYAEIKVKEAGLQDHIRFLLCDYRQLPDTHRYDRVIACEMIEAVGHEYMEEFFGCCESLLVEDDIFVLQFTAVADELYDEYRRSAGFIKEYIFHGGCLPSLSRVTSAMATSSRLCVEHVENIGIHYFQTLRYWRQDFLKNHSEILALGFDQKFIRTWEYYFDYCAAGFKSSTIRNYQIVFSRTDNVAAFGDPYEGISTLIRVCIDRKVRK